MRANIPTRMEDLVQRISKTEKERDILFNEYSNLRKNSISKVDEIIKMQSGITALEGPGVIITIDDGKRQNILGEIQYRVSISAGEALELINDLKSSGAKAISINGIRLITTSAICPNSFNLSVDNITILPPYEMIVIGNPQILEAGAKIRGGVVERVQAWWGIQVNIKQFDNVKVPAYKEAFKFNYAKPISEN